MVFAAQVRQMVILVALVAGLWLLHLYARVLPTAAILVVWGLLGLGLARALFLRAQLRRRGWLAVYLRPEGSLSTLLRGGALMAVVQTVLGSGLALLFLVAVMRSADPLIWMSLLALAMLLPPASVLLQARLRVQASDLYLGELAWRTASAVLGAMLLALLTWHAFGRTYPDFGAATLDQAVWHMVGLQQARSGVALTALQMAAAGDGLRLWLGQQLLPTPGTSFWQALGWVLLLAQEAVFVWSYLLLCRVVVMPMDISLNIPIREER